MFGSRRPIAELDAPPLDLAAAWARPFDADPQVERLVAGMRKELEAAKPPAKTTLEREELRAGLALYEADGPGRRPSRRSSPSGCATRPVVRRAAGAWSGTRFALGAESCRSGRATDLAPAPSKG